MEREAVIPNFPIMASTVLMTDRSGRDDRKVREKLSMKKNNNNKNNTKPCVCLYHWG